MHVKRQILHLLRQALEAGLPVNAVHLDYLDPLPVSACPAALVRESDRGEDIAELTTEGQQRRDLWVDIALCVESVQNYGDAVADLEVATSKLLQAWWDDRAPLVVQLHALCAMGIRHAATRPFFSGEGAKAIAVQRQLWRFSYAIDPSDPEQPLS